MKLMKKLKKWADYFMVSEEAFALVRTELVEVNRKALMVMAPLAAAAFFVMALISLFFDSMSSSVKLYLAEAVFALFVSIAARSIRNPREKHVRPLAYLFIELLFFYGIAMGTLVEPGQLTVSLNVLLVALPLAFTEKPQFMNFVITSGVVIYAVIGKITQTPQIYELNLLTVIPYGIISMFISSATMRIKFDRLVMAKENSYLSHYDKMTDLLNRRCYEEDVEEYRQRETPVKLGLCMFDVNGLKDANDSKGHLAGDELIIATADCIKKVFLPFGKCYRVGGDEFAAILEGSFPEPEKLKADLAEAGAAFHGKYVSEITISVGIEVAESSSIVEASKEADRKMYMHKAEYYKSKGIDRKITANGDPIEGIE